MSEIQHNMNDREVATVLHALRSLQFGCGSEECDHFEDVEPLNTDEIDVLCERINFAKHISNGTRTITVWTLTGTLVDTHGREALVSAVYTDQHAAFVDLVKRWATTAELRKAVSHLLENKQYKELSEETAPGVWDGLDSFVVRSHQIEVPAQ